MLRKLKALAVLLLLGTLASAQNPQTPIYPTRVATDNDLYVASNKAGTKLTSPISSGDTTIPVQSTTTFIIPTIILIDSELIAVCGKTSNSFTACSSGRGYDLTLPATHNNNSPISGAIASRFFNQVASEIKAIEAQGSWHFDPGTWQDQKYAIPLDVTIGASINPDQDRLAITNAVGHRPAAVQGDIHPPADPTATTYEADAIAGISINNSSSTNAVSGSFFSAIGANGPSGFLTTAGTAVTELTGPSFQSNWAGSIIVINGVNYVIASVSPPNTLTLTTSAGSQPVTSWYKHIYAWGINTLITDGFPGLGGTPHYQHAYLTNEWDANIFDATSTLIMHSIGGNGTIQPLVAYGYLVNTLSASSPGTVKWNCGFCLLDGVANTAMQIGTSANGNNTGSMPVQYYSRSSAGDVDSAVTYADPGGNYIIHPGFTTQGAALNPQTIIEDAMGNILVGFQGAIGQVPAVQMGNNTLLVKASYLFTNLPASPNGAEVYCSDCTSGPTCTASGPGSPATRVNGAWSCGSASGSGLGSLTGIIKATAGTPAVVTGTSTNCVHVDTTSAPCGGTVDAQVIAQANFASVTSGSSTAYALVPTTAIPAYAVGQVFYWKPDVTNTSTGPTANVSGKGAKPIIHKSDSSLLAIGELDTTAYCTSFYDGTSMLTSGCFTGPGTIALKSNTSLATAVSGFGNVGFDVSNEVLKAKGDDGTASVTVKASSCALGEIQSIDANGNITCVSRVRTCVIDNDTQSATALTVGQFSGGCFFPKAATLIEVDVFGGTGIIGGTITTTGTSSINIQKYTPSGGATTTLLSGALATATGYACALTAISGTCSTGITSSGTITISTTAISSGDWIRTSAATPDTAQTWYRIGIVYTLN